MKTIKSKNVKNSKVQITSTFNEHMNKHTHVEAMILLGDKIVDILIINNGNVSITKIIKLLRESAIYTVTSNLAKMSKILTWFGFDIDTKSTGSVVTL